MKLLLLFAFLALVCVARTAPTPSSTSRVLILPDYHDDDDADHEDKPHIDVDDNISSDEDEDEPTTTTRTTKTTIRSIPVFPSRGTDLIPSRRPIPTQRTSSIRTITTTTAFGDDDFSETADEYNGDYKYIEDIRRYLQQLIEEFRKMIRKITGSSFNDVTQRDQINQYDD
ncbi:unnamed protein product [Rotaria sp. Silwood1]|nr:unnamed protein product [Rotaria sp. Silwood1]CAF0739495.1 unnamed protein product [Rotaria sp. Silwood1]CAF0794488.1 unnamed protein product [Rotaria sp. Silwood1]CAF3333304.1 unnamed protein product [Rotaria sp. Silwood1]CAF3334944.1 unnamed protein product [Rotaria sp. Silwood1]